jgi:hypothetical protein
MNEMAVEFGRLATAEELKRPLFFEEGRVGRG